MDFDQESAEPAPASDVATAAEPEAAPAAAAPPAAAPAESADQESNPWLAAISTPLKHLWSSDKSEDDGEGDAKSVKTEAGGEIDLDKQTASGEASRSTSTSTTDAETGGSTSSSTTVKADASVGADGGKGDASYATSSSEDHGDGGKESSSTTVAGGVEVKDGEVSGGGSVSSDRASSTEDKDTGEKSSKDDKVGVDVHVGDGDSKVGGSYDRARSSDDGTGTTTSSSTSVAGHVGEQGSEAKASYAATNGSDDQQGDAAKTSVAASGDVKVGADGNVSGDGSASRTTSEQTKDAETGGSTSSSTAVKADGSFDEHGGKANASVGHDETASSGDGATTSSSTTVAGGVQVKDGQASGDGSVSGQRGSSYEDKDTGEKQSSSDKVTVGVHVGEGDSKVDAGYDRARATDDGAAKTATDTKVDGHVGENDAAASVARTNSSEAKDADGRVVKQDSSVNAGVTTGDSGTTVTAGRKASTSDSDGNGATEASSSDVNAKVGLDKNGNASAEVAGKGAKEWSYQDKDSSLATNRGASADGSIHVDADKMAAAGSVEAHRGQTDEDGHATSQSGKLGASASTNDKGDTAVGVDGSYKSSDGYADKDAKVAGSTDKQFSGGVSSDKDSTTVKGDFAAAKKLADEDTGSAENSAHGGASVKVNKDGSSTTTVTGGVASKQTVNTEDGSQSKGTKIDGSYSQGSDGSWRAGGSMGKTEDNVTKGPDGSETKNSKSSTVGVTGGEDADGAQHVGVSAGSSNTTTNPDGSKSTSGVDGGAEVVSGEGKEGVAGHFGFTQDGNRVGVSGGYQQQFSKPSQNADGTWSVPYQATAQGGVEASGGDKDAKAGGSVNASSTTFGSRTFKSQEEADDFYKKGDIPATEVPKTAADAKNLPEGTTIGTATSGGVGANGGVSGGGVGVNAGVEVHGGSSVAVTSRGNGVVEVDAGQSHGESGSVGMSGGPASMGVGASEDKKSSAKVQFDLNTPEGQTAYDQYMKDPSKVPEGGKVLQTQETEKDGTTTNFGLGAQAAENKTYEKTVTKDADGNVVDTDQKGTDGVNLSVPGLGHDNEKTSLEAKTDADGNTVYAAEKKIDATNATDANQALAAATNTTTDVNVKGKSSGKWDVDTTYTKDQMEAFAKQVESGEYNKPLDTVGDDAREKLKQGLATAGDDPVKRAEALTKFTEDGGDKALSQVKDATGQDGEHYVKLEGDKYLTGAEGRKALDDQIADAEKRIEVGDGANPSTSGDIRELLAQQKERQRQIADPANYPDLPSGARAQESARSQADIDRLQNLLADAKDQRADADPAIANPDEATAQAQARMQQSSQALDQAHAADDKAYADARLQNKIQDGYYSGSTSTPREQFGDKDLGVFDNSETKAYGQADKTYADAQAALKEANRLEGLSDRADDSTADGAAAGADAAQRAAEQHQIAMQKFAEAQKSYQGIAGRHKDDSEQGTWDGQNHQLKPGE